MAVLHESSKEVTCKIVYHGTGMCGKTTSLMFLNENLPPSQHGRFITLETPTERTLYFDFLPVIIEARGFRFRYLLFTTPGQDYYEASRKLVLKGADGIVYVVDSQRDRLKDNLSALAIFEKNLSEMHQRPELLPMVIQYNKRDLPRCITLEEAERKFNRHHVLAFPAVAKTGQGVYESFLSIARLSLAKLTSLEGESRMAEGFKSTVVTERDKLRLESVLASFCGEVGASGALLVDESSSLISSHGTIPAKDYETLGALLACNFTAAQELAHNMSGRGFTGIRQKGNKWSMLANRVDGRRLLVVLHDPALKGGKMERGIIYARKTLSVILRQIDLQSPERLGRFADVFSSVSRAAVSRMTAN